MSWFKRDKSVIPPVTDNTHEYNPRYGKGQGDAGAPTNPNPAGHSPAYYRASNSTYNASRDRELYNTPSAPPAQNEPYQRRQIGLDPYKLQGRHPAGVDQDRAELFSGYDPKAPRAKAQSAGRDITSGDYDPTEGDDQEQTQAMDSDEEIEGIKRDIRWQKQETVGSSRNALRIAREAEETARNTLLKLGDQSEKLADTERHLDVAKAHTNRAEDATTELKQLNKSIFNPMAYTWNKKKANYEKEQRVLQRHEQERMEREEAMAAVRDSQNRIGRAATFGMPDEDQIQKKANRVRGDQRKRYQFEATESDEELEDELDDNLDEIGDVAKRLKALALAQGQEVDKQNDRLTGLSTKTELLNAKIDRGTERLKRIK